MKKPKSGSRKTHKTHGKGNSAPSQAPAPKWRPVFGQPLPRGFVPPTKEAEQAAAAKPPAGKSSGRQLGEASRQNLPATPVKKDVATAPGHTKLNPATLPQHFAKMDPTERILLAYVIYKQPKGWHPDSFYSYDLDSLRYLDSDLPGPDYVEVTKILTKWTKAGILSTEKGNSALSLVDGTAATFWQWLEKKGVPLVVDAKPQQVYAADLPGTLDNILNFLLWVDRGEVLVTRNNEINKNSLKRVLAAITEPVRYPGLFVEERYFYWLVSVTQFLNLIRSHNGRLKLTAAGRELTKRANVLELLGQIWPANLQAVKHKGFFLVLPLLAHCTGWISWGKLVTDLIAPAQNIGNLLRVDRVITLLDPWRFLGLLDWGTYENDIFFRVTPLGQSVFPKLLQGAKLGPHLNEIRTLADPVYPMSGPDTAYVQPNFEIMMPRSVSWTARWQLGQFALLEQQDQMLKYRLDKTYLLDALKRGFPAGEVLTTLSRLSPYPLPENLVLTIQQWIESFGQVTFMQLVLLECASAEQTAAIAGARKYQDYVLGLYNPTTVIVRDPEKLRKLLEKQGIYPMPGVLNGLEVAKCKALNPTRPSGMTELDNVE